MSFQSDLAKKIFYWGLAAIGTGVLSGAGWTVKTVVRHESAFARMETQMVYMMSSQRRVEEALNRMESR